jgi:hypothetical protein
MPLNRGAASIASLSLLLTTPLFAHNAALQPNAATAQPPVFQGLMVDAKGKTIGRYVFSGLYGGGTAMAGFNAFVVRQISGIWVMIPVGDFKTGFAPVRDPSFIQFFLSIN